MNTGALLQEKDISLNTNVITASNGSNVKMSKQTTSYQQVLSNPSLMSDSSWRDYMLRKMGIKCFAQPVTTINHKRRDNGSNCNIVIEDD